MAQMPSGLLSPRENNDLKETMAPRRQQSLATAVARLYVSNPNARNPEWIPVVTGVVCFVKDFDRRSYYIIAYDMDRKTQVWEQEMYNEMVYQSRHSWFHSFEAAREMAGVCFADDREAADFLATVRLRLSKLETREKRRSMRLVSLPTQQQSGSSSGLPPIHEVSLNRPKPPREATAGQPVQQHEHRRRRNKLSKADISSPTQFVHVSGVKASREGFQMVDNLNEIDPRLRQFLKVAGLNDNILQNPAAKKRIESFVQENNVMQEISRSSRRVAPTQAPPPAPPSQKAVAVNRAFAPNVSSQQPPRPPAPVPKANNPPAAARPQPPQPGPAAKGGAPAPPPPPPPPPPPGPMAQPMPMAPAVGKPTSATSPGELKPKAPQAPGRTNLLDEIRNAGGLKSLHRAEERKASTVVPAAIEEASLTSLLEDAFVKIKSAAAMSSEEEEESESDESWSEEDC